VNLVLIAATLFLIAFPGGQALSTNSPVIRLREVRFAHVTQLDSRKLESCAARLQAQAYTGGRWLEEVAERARVLCWQSHGYFRTVVSATAEEYTRDVYAVVLSLKEGPQYRLGHISFQNFRVVVSADLLRSVVPLHDGDVFNPDKIKEGVDNLRKAYANIGYIEFTSKPTTEVDDEQRIINVRWDVSEGRPFFVRTIQFDGVSPAIADSLRSRLLLKSGSVYSQGAMEKSLDKMRTLLPLRTGLHAELSADNDLGVVDLQIKRSDTTQK
jgi:outer membrane protein assembly factor BamA